MTQEKGLAVQPSRMAQFRRERRACIYARDWWACVYCGRAENLTLDHMHCRSDGGSSNPENLLTCCYACNTKRGALPFHLWAGERAAELYAQARKPLPNMVDILALLREVQRVESGAIPAVVTSPDDRRKRIITNAATRFADALIAALDKKEADGG